MGGLGPDVGWKVGVWEPTWGVAAGPELALNVRVRKSMVPSGLPRPEATGRGGEHWALGKGEVSGLMKKRSRRQR